MTSFAASAAEGGPDDPGITSKSRSASNLVLLMAARGTAAVFMTFAAAGVVGALAEARVLETRNRRLEDIAP